MPIVALVCPCTPGRLPLDHFKNGCKGIDGGMKMPLAWARRIVRGRLSDRYHADGRLTTTRLLTCPRETLIQDLLPVVFDVRAANSLEWGTAIHSHLETEPEEDQYVEIRFGGPGDALPPARLFAGLGGLPEDGILICGKVDHVTLGYGEIHDYKCHGESSQRFKASGKLDETTAVQMNIYRKALEQVVVGATAGCFQRLIAYHGAMTAARGPEPWIPQVQPMMTEEEILNTRTSGGASTVREHIEDYIGFTARAAAGVELRENLKLLPLRGRTMYGKKKCSDYCMPGTKAECDGLEGIFTF